MNSEISLEQIKSQVDECIRRVIDDRKISAKHISPAYVFLWNNIEDVAIANGKRLRPYLTVIGNGKLDDSIIPVAAAQELIHVAMLMHDDVIDRDFSRHGKKNINGIYRDVYGKYLDEQQATHYANSAGLLAGDALIAESYRLLYGSDYEPEVKQTLVERLSLSIYEVIGGELMDVEAAFTRTDNYDPMQIYRYKTAGYSFMGPLVSGAVCAGLGSHIIKELEGYALHVGIAFQMQDDLLGIFGDEAKTGKSTLTDLREGKKTLLIQYYKSVMDEEQAERFMAFGDSKASNDSLHAIKTDIENSGAKEKTIEIIDQYFKVAIAHLQHLPNGIRKTELEKFTNWLRKRGA